MSNKYVFKFLDKSKKRGIIKYADGSIYEGYLRNKKPHGRGKHIFKGDSHPCEMYIGDFVDGIPEGEGTYNSKIGSYTGQWKNNKHHGEGILLSKRGEYRGQFFNGKWQGHGKIIRANGDVYEGEFKNSKYDGFGKLWYDNGDICEGEFKNSDMVQAKCTYIYKNGDTYVGTSKNGLAHGKGVWTDSVNNLIYDGSWTNGDLKGRVNILTKHIGRKSQSILHSNVDFNKFIKRKYDPKQYYHYLIPEISKYHGRSEAGLKKFINIKTSQKRAHYMIQESGSKNTLDQKKLYVNKPSAYFFISAHGAYGDSAVDWKEYPSAAGGPGVKLRKFIVPEGIRLIFFDKSEMLLSSSIDDIILNENFMKPSLIQRKTYRKITPVVLFSELKGKTTSIDVNDALDKTILNSTYHLFRKFIAQQKTQATVSDILKDVQLEDYIDEFNSNGITHVDDLVLLTNKDLIDFGLNLGPRKRLLKKIALLKDIKYSLSIYDSGMECVNLSLVWDHELSGSRPAMKLGIYPLPNTKLNSTSYRSLHDADGEIIEHEIFNGGFIPDVDCKGNLIYYTNSMLQWNMFSGQSVPISSLVEMLPKGTEKHPCVYFVSACRGISGDLLRQKSDMKGLVRQHSDSVHKPFIQRQLSE